MDIRPDVHILESLRASSINYPVLLSEAVDNSFDAGATQVAVTINPDLISITDNGSGITRDREDSLVRLGGHGPMSTTSLGRYGIGIKYHAINAGDEFEVHSISADGRMTLKVDWGQLIRSREWKIRDAFWTFAPEMAPRTKIVIKALRHKPPSPKLIDRVCNDLAQRFYPAIMGGRTITLNGIAIPLLAEPSLTNIVNDDLEFPEGRKATVHAGLLADAKSSRLRQVQVSYGHRVIMPASDFGCGDHTGTGAMFARIHLSGPWGLGRFKDEIVDDYLDGLSEAVGEVLAPILRLCEAKNLSAELEEITQLINEALPSEWAPIRPPHDKEAPPAQDGERRKRTQHGRSETGDESVNGPARRSSASRAQLMIELSDQSIEDCGYGIVTFGNSRRDRDRVKLTKDHPDIAALLKLRDKRFLARQLLILALMLYDHERFVTSRADLVDRARGFGARISDLMSRQSTYADEAA